MGMIDGFLSMLFGGNRNVVAETAGVFRVNAEAAAQREADASAAALAQFASEFALPRRGLFDRVIDGLNRLPRPMLALSTMALLGSAMIEPLWFAERMQGLVLVPEPLWWLMGAVVSFYFGARHQVKSQEFQQAIAETFARAGGVGQAISQLRSIERAEDDIAPTLRTTPEGPYVTGANAALDDWYQRA